MPNPEEESFKELVENKFYCSRKFVEEIESIALENKEVSQKLKDYRKKQAEVKGYKVLSK